MIEIKNMTYTSETTTAVGQPPKAPPSYGALLLLSMAAIAIISNKIYINDIHADYLNAIPAAASLVIVYLLIRSTSHAGRKHTSFSRWMRSALLAFMFLLAAEFGLRCLSYHRTLRYERQGDLLFTPVPDQEYLEKISLSRSHINHLGLRGDDIHFSSGKRIILCLGDSVTYGYGVDDAHTYPAELQSALDKKYPAQFLVLNAGVDAYPVSLMREKFVSLWQRGVHPDMVVVGYSFNEGGLGHLVQTDRELLSRFGRALWLKNQLRGIALYNLIVENWGQTLYDRMKRYMISGADSRTMAQADLRNWYEDSLRQLAADLQSRQVSTVFLLFAGLNTRTDQYDASAPFQAQFKEFAGRNRIPLLASDAIFSGAQNGYRELRPFFLDQCHMNTRGTKAVGEAVASYISEMAHP